MRGANRAERLVRKPIFPLVILCYTECMKKRASEKSEKMSETYAVSLLFDESSSEEIRVVWRKYAEATENAVLVEQNAPPHITLGMFRVESEKQDRLKVLFEDFAKRVGTTFAVDFSGIDSFKGKVIFLSIKNAGSDAESASFSRLKELNLRLHEIFLPQFEAGGNRNYLPENFFPHVALAVKLSSEQFEKGLSLDFPEVAELGSGKFSALSLARCHPYEEIARTSLSHDALTSFQRHANMAAIHSTGGKLETSLRSELFRFGFRFRKNDRRLSGSPDIVFPHYRAVIFVNGCFWHAHGWKSEESLIESGVLDEDILYSLRCEKFRMPKTNPDFWLAKFTRNRARDLRDIKKLLEEGWRVGVVWECSITGRGRREKIRSTAEKISLWLEEEYSVRFREF